MQGGVKRDAKGPGDSLARMERPLPPALVADGEPRWGWELRDLRAPVFPYREEPPAWLVPVPGWTHELAAKVERSAAEKSERQKIVLVTGGAAAGCALVGYWLLGGLLGFVGLVFLLAAAVLAVVAGWYAWQVWGAPRQVKAIAEKRYEGWMEETLASHTGLQQRLAEWERGRDAHEGKQVEKVRAQTRWVPVRPSDAALRGRVDVLGGDGEGRTVLLAHMVASLVGAGVRVNLLDLGQQVLAGPLAGMVRSAGLEAQVRSFPEGMGPVNLLAGLSPREVSGLLTDALHAVDGTTSYQERSVDADLLRQVSELLAPRLTFRRLHAALRVLRRQPADPAVLETDEADRLRDLLGETARAGLDARIGTLVAALEPLAAAGEHADHGPVFGTGDIALRVVQVSAHELPGEVALLRQLLFQLVLHDLRQQAAGGVEQALIVAGADHLRREHLDQLDQLARHRGVRLTLVFAHLRDAAVEVLGGGDASVFLRLGNAQEAERAATAIGKGYQFLASQYTFSDGRNTSTGTTESTGQTHGTHSSTSMSDSRGPGGRGSSTGTSRGESESTSVGQTHTVQFGSQTSDAVSYQRTYDYTVIPSSLQALGQTAFVMVDSGHPGSPVLGDCDPVLLERAAADQLSGAQTDDDRLAGRPADRTVDRAPG